MRCSVHLNKRNWPTVKSKSACSNSNRMCRPPVVRQCLIVDQDLKNESAIDRVDYIIVNLRGGGGSLLYCASYCKGVEHFKLTIVFIGKFFLFFLKTKFRLFLLLLLSLHSLEYIHLWSRIWLWSVLRGYVVWFVTWWEDLNRTTNQNAKKRRKKKKKKTQTNSNNNKQQRLIDFGWRKSGLWFVLVALISHCRRHLQKHRTEEEDGKAKHVSEWPQSLPGGGRYLHHQTWARFMLLHVALRPRSLVVRGIWGRVHYLCRPDHYC